MESPFQYSVDFLGQWNLRLEDLSDFVGPLGPSDVLLLVGSIPDGLANPSSDINLLVIGEKPLLQNPHAALPNSDRPSRPPVNIQYRERQKVEAIVEKLARGSIILRDPSKLESVEAETFDMLNSSEIGLLHYIRSCVALGNTSTVQLWREQIRDLPDFFLLYCLANHFNSREDVIAQIKYGDPLSALWMLSNAADFLAGAMLASIGETNPYPRWRARLLRRNESTLGKERVDRILRYFLPAGDAARATAVVQHAFSSFDLALLEVLGRRETLAAPLREFRKRVRYIARFDELANLQAAGKI